MQSRARPPLTPCVAPRPRCLSGRGWFDTIRPQCERVPLILCARWLSPEPTDHVRYRTCADGTVRPPQPSAGEGAWTPLTGARDARRVSSSASECAVQRRKRLNPGLGEHHRYPLATPCAWGRAARPHTSRVSFRAPGARSAAKGGLFRGTPVATPRHADAVCGSITQPNLHAFLYDTTMAHHYAPCD